MGRLEVRICGARSMGDTRRASTPDLYVKVMMGDRKKNRPSYKTKVARSSLHPVWNEVVKFHVADYDTEQVVFELWNNNVIVDDLMGLYALSVNGLRRGVVSDICAILEGTGSTSVELHLQVLAVDFGADPAPNSTVVDSIEEYDPDAVTQAVTTTTGVRKDACAEGVESAQKLSRDEPVMGIPLLAQVAPPPPPLLQPVYAQQPTYVQQAPPYAPQMAPQLLYVQQVQPASQPIYHQHAPLQSGYDGSAQQSCQYMYRPSPL
ncbi:C2 domain protein, putative [Leishmania tarentolae]|uniref:C2 domain protein, putative n=1 Tax=Leishmania tarentolae TaxID=5689 RepID=A0A640KPS6_LEITA|nr:C2 domain protein, putative [Leishmania tarentolae]